MAKKVTVVLDDSMVVGADVLVVKATSGETEYGPHPTPLLEALREGILAHPPEGFISARIVPATSPRGARRKPPIGGNR